MPSAPSARLAAVSCGTAAAIVLACRSPAPPDATRAPDGAWTDLDPSVRPRLEDVFLEPSLQGTPPRLAGLSADGRWAVVEWRPRAELAALVDGETPRPGLRLLDADAPAAGNGSPLDEVFGTEETEGRERWAWSHRGARLAYARGSELHLLVPGEGGPRRLLAGEPAGEQPEADDDEERGQERDGSLSELAFAPDDASLRFVVDGELYVLPVEPLADTPRARSELRSPSEGFERDAGEVEWSTDLRVAFLPPEEEDEEEEAEAKDAERARDGFHVWHVETARGVALEGLETAEDLEHASLSPDGRFVFAADFDRSGEPPPTLVPDYLTERVTTRDARRLLADDGPSPFALWIWDAHTGTRTELLAADEARGEARADGTEGDAPDERGRGSWWLGAIGWAPQSTPDAPARYAFERRSADHRELEIWCWSEGALSRVWAERDAAWIGGRARRAAWNASGTHLLVGSESTTATTTPGRAQLFGVPAGGGPARQLTELAGELWRFRSLAGGGVLIEGSDEDPARRVLGRLSPDQVAGRAPPGVEPYAAPAGWNDRARASRDGSRVVFAHGSLGRPAELWTVTARGATRLTDATPRVFDEVDWILPERLTLTTTDGRAVHSHVFLPDGVTLEGARSGRPRAAVVFVHGAGYLQNVTDSMTRYPLNLMFHSRLARLGYVVLDVDYRGSAGYGRDFRTDVQYHLGGKDLDDIHLAVDELARRGVLDARRVGIYGGSYGGFITLMALSTAGERWVAGAALRSVTDWRTYHPGYTQPRLGRPSTHPDAYARSSPIDHVDTLDAPVLVLHGMGDSNVFAQDSIRLIEALIDRGADFEAMLYPSQGHAFEDGPHWLDEYRRIERFLLAHLGPPH